MRIEIPDLFDALRRIDERDGGSPADSSSNRCQPAFYALRRGERGIFDTETFSPAATQDDMSCPLMGPMLLGMSTEGTTCTGECCNKLQQTIVRGICGLPAEVAGR